MKFTLLATAALAALALSTPAHADAWDVAKAAGEAYLEANYASTGVDNVTLTKSEFGPTSNKAAGHLAIDVIFDGFIGGQLIYVPETGAVYEVWNAGSASKLNGTATTIAMYCPKGAAAGTCTGESLVGNAGGSGKNLIKDAIARECDWKADFRDWHTC